MLDLVFEEARRLVRDGFSPILATIVSTRGSTPQKPGARLLVREDGSIAGTLGGGCVEADVVIEARRLLATGGADSEIRQFVLDEDIAFRDGLVCGGSMVILLERLSPAWLPVIDAILDARSGRGDAALAIRFTVDEDAIRRFVPLAGDESDAALDAPLTTIPNGRLLVRADGSSLGTLGDLELDSETARCARDLMPKGREGWLDAPHASRVYIEGFTTPPTVVIAGGGHVGRSVYTLATFLGYRTIIIDDRPEFANAERFPQASEIVVDAFDRGIARLPLGPNHHVLIATRGHKLDDEALLAAARSNAGWIGLLGSRRKAVLLFRRLYEAGVPEDRIRMMRAPVGLDLGGRRPEDIALSILAEITAEIHGASARGLSMMSDRVRAKIKGGIARDRAATGEATSAGEA